MKKKFVASLPGLDTHPFKLSDVGLGLKVAASKTMPIPELPLELELQLLLDLADPDKTPLVSQLTRDAAVMLLAKRGHT